jgi:hypothetical protein
VASAVAKTLFGVYRAFGIAARDTGRRSPQRFILASWDCLIIGARLIQFFARSRNLFLGSFQNVACFSYLRQFMQTDT